MQKTFIVVCEISPEVAQRLRQSGVDPHGVTRFFATKRAALKCAAQWTASGLGPAQVL